MKDTTRIKHVSDVNLEEKRIKGRPPFRVQRENQRRFVRLEISSPMSLHKVKDIFGNFWPDGEGYAIHGEILNISAGGVLVEVDQPLNEGDIVSMRFSLQEVETLDNVLGIVKRTDQSEDCLLAGIEFVGKESLCDMLSQGELEMLSEEFTDFKQRVQDVLQKYIYRERVASDAQ